MSKQSIAKFSADDIRKRVASGQSQSDWARVDATTDAEIEAAMRSNPDWADTVDIDWSQAAVVYPAPKSAISIRLDQDVIDFFKGTGKGYQTRINAVLRHFMVETKKNKKAG
ncbi:MAG: hypothetical protein ABS58_14215 [Mesorhizobium sp. SCN 65-20]|nr:MAG: hypothetical protein ABS58_14215 [Mesorhizobium sp. SCN 65-20]